MFQVSFWCVDFYVFPRLLPPLPLGAGFAAAAGLVTLFLCLAGVPPSISATSSSFLLDPPLASLDLPGRQATSFQLSTS